MNNKKQHSFKIKYKVCAHHVLNIYNLVQHDSNDTPCLIQPEVTGDTCCHRGRHYCGLWQSKKPPLGIHFGNHVTSFPVCNGGQLPLYTAESSKYGSTERGGSPSFILSYFRLSVPGSNNRRSYLVGACPPGCSPRVGPHSVCSRPNRNYACTVARH